MSDQYEVVHHPPLTVIVDVVRYVQKSLEPNLEPHLLFHLPPGGVFDSLPHLDHPAGESPPPLVRLVVSLYEKDAVALVNEGPSPYHGEQRILSFPGHS